MCGSGMRDARIERLFPVPLSIFTLAPDLSFEDRAHSCDGPRQKIRLFCSLDLDQLFQKPVSVLPSKVDVM